MQMQIVSKPSMLCKDIYELEKDFKYNLALLKLRDAEIERYKMQNIKLLHDMQLKDQEITHLHTDIQNLKAIIFKVNTEKTSMENQCKESVSQLWDTITELKRTHDNFQNAHDMQTKKDEMELKAKYTNITRIMATEHQRRMSEMNTLLEREICTMNKLKTEIRTLLNENMTLRTQYQDKQAYYASKFSIFESELKATNEQKIKLQAELVDLKNDSTDFETKFANVLSEANKLKQELQEYIKKSDILEKNLSGILKENKELNFELNTNTNKLQSCSLNLQCVEHERDQLKIKCENLERKTLESKCTKTEHQNIDIILKQNSILQEVVKGIRKERNDNQEIETKVRKLEDLIGQLKASMVIEPSNTNIIY
ncbi:hypothetical protein CBL_12021 [Carabus blaptoides fortunei]